MNMQQTSEKSALVEARREALEKLKVPRTKEQVREQREVGPEKTPENFGFDEEGETNEESVTLGRATAATTGNDFTEREKQIEQVLEQGLEGIYLSLPADKKIEFKQAGEKTAHQINLLLLQTKVKIKKIISLVRDWLQIIPGINRFFLEQEAKIKADELINLNASKEGGDK